MDIDKSIFKQISEARSTTNFPIFKPIFLAGQFYSKQKPVRLVHHKVSQSQALPKVHHKSRSIFITQVASNQKTEKSLFQKVYETCLKKREDREYNELIEVSKWLGFIVFLSPLSKVKLQILGKHFHSRCYRRGEYLYCDKDPLNLLFIILHGEVDLFRDNKKVETRSLRDVVGENSLVLSENCFFTARAATETHTLLMNTNQFLELLGQDPMRNSIEIMKILRKINLFQEIPLIKLISFSTKLQRKNARKGDVLYNYHEKPRGFYILFHGSVKEKCILSDELEDSKTIRPGEYFGSRDLIVGCLRRSKAEALTKCELYEIPKELFVIYMNMKKFAVVDNDEFIEYMDSSIYNSRRPSASNTRMHSRRELNNSKEIGEQ